MIFHSASLALFAMSSFALIIPANVTDLKSKLKGAFGKAKPKEGEVVKPDEGLTRRTLSKIAEEKAKRKALSDELTNEKTTSARKQEIIDGLQAQLDTANVELEDHKAKLEDLAPKAKKWSDFEHKERTKLLQSFPPEEQKDAKAIAENMDIDTFRKYTSRVTGKPTEGQQQGDKGGKTKDWNSILDSNRKDYDPAVAEKAIAADPAGFNEFMEKRN